MCKQLGISHAAYYKWLHRTIPEQESENTKLAELIKEYDERFGHILGYRRMTSWINHFNHTSYSKNRVHRIMKKLGIHSIIRNIRSPFLIRFRCIESTLQLIFRCCLRSGRLVFLLLFTDNRMYSHLLHDSVNSVFAEEGIQCNET